MEKRDQERKQFLFSASVADSGRSSVKIFDEKLLIYHKIDQAIPEGSRPRSSSIGNTAIEVPYSKSQIPRPRNRTTSETEARKQVKESSVFNSTESLSSKSPYANRKDPFVRGGANSTLPKTFILKPSTDKPKTPELSTNRPPKFSYGGPSTVTQISDFEYRMDHTSRGRVIIFNHENFKDEEWTQREGTDVDVTRLKKTVVGKLGYKPSDVSVFNDLTYTDLDRKLSAISLQDHSNNDCLMVFVLTHGSRDDRIFAYDVDYSVKTLWRYFTAEKCNTLAGKPKIFFIVACRGDSTDAGYKLGARQRRKTSLNTERDAVPTGPQASYTIPVWADFLTVYSTVQGYYSYRDKFNGTWYVQALCDEVNNSDLQSTHLVDILTKVNRKVAIEYETYNDMDPAAHKKKQCPYITSTLTRFVYMRDKT